MNVAFRSIKKQKFYRSVIRKRILFITWIVISKYNGGLFGLVAEDIGGVEKGDWFKGFFTSKTEVIQKVLDEMNHIMMTNINFFDLESKETGL